MCSWGCRLYYVSSESGHLSLGATQSIVGVYFTALYRALASSRTRFLDHTQRRATVGRTPLNEWSVRRLDFYLTTHNTHNRQTSMRIRTLKKKNTTDKLTLSDTSGAHTTALRLEVRKLTTPTQPLDTVRFPVSKYVFLRAISMVASHFHSHLNRCTSPSP
jgi:hypothetical protein